MTAADASGKLEQTSWIKRVMPIMQWLPNYQRPWRQSPLVREKTKAAPVTTGLQSGVKASLENLDNA